MLRNLSRGTRKALRTLAQVIVGGGFTALVTAIAGGLTTTSSGIVLGIWTVVLAWCQNTAEDKGVIPTVLPSPAAPGLPAPLIADKP